MRSQTLILMIAVFAANLPAMSACAETYPARPIRLITPQSAGASMDILVRILAPRLTERLGQAVVVDIRSRISNRSR